MRQKYTTPLYDYQAQIRDVTERAKQGLPVTVRAEHRTPEYKIGLVRGIFNDGVSFMLPVRAGTKKLAWKKPKRKPIFLETINRILYEHTAHGNTRTYKYDLAVVTGTWRMPDRSQDAVLVVLDVDNWDKLSTLAPDVCEIIRKQPTFCIQTKRGIHFYYWMPAWAAKSQSIPGVIDLQGRGRIAVVTGVDRNLCYNFYINQMAHEDVNTILRFFKKMQGPTYRERWSLAKVKGVLPPVPTYPPGYKAPLGSRNYFVNGQTYRQRFKLSDQELIDYAVDLAQNQCEPPYPVKEAEAVARSIIRNARRFADKPLVTTPTIEMEKGRHAVYRLAKYFPTVGERFTRADYEQALRADRWIGNKSGRIPITQRDLAYNVEHGFIKVVDKVRGPKGGNAALVYERISPCNLEMSFTLPIKQTAKAMRLGRMMWLLPDKEMEVVRRTLARYLGVKKETISRYAKDLISIEKWLGPLIVRTIQKPLIGTAELNPKVSTTTEWPIPNERYRQLHDEFVQYRPSLYKRQPFYHRIMRKNSLPKRKSRHSTIVLPPSSEAEERAWKHVDPSVLAGRRRWVGSLLQDVLERRRRFANYEFVTLAPAPLRFNNPHTSALGKAIAEVMAKLAERRIRERGFDDTVEIDGETLESLLEPSELFAIMEQESKLRLCKHCQTALDPEGEELFCKTCEKKRKDIEFKRRKILNTHITMNEDCCVFCQKIFPTTEVPLLGICPQCAPNARLKYAPIVTFYCPNPTCHYVQHCAHYTDWDYPEACPKCKVQIHAFCPWRREPFPPEETLPMYPLNFYLADARCSLFDHFDSYAGRSSNSLAWVMSHYPKESALAWRQYRSDLYIELPCPSCGVEHRIERKTLKDVPKWEEITCKACQLSYYESTNRIPRGVYGLIAAEEKAEIKRLEDLFKQNFTHPLKRQEDIQILVKIYGVDWVHYSIVSAAQASKMKVVRNPYPYINSILTNWKKQGYVNFEDRHRGRISLTQARQAARTWKLTELVELAHNEPTPYHLYAKVIQDLTHLTAPLIAHAINTYGDHAVRYAILEMARHDTTHWNYAHAILKHLRSVDKLETVLYDKDAATQLSLEL